MIRILCGVLIVAVLGIAWSIDRARRIVEGMGMRTNRRRIGAALSRLWEWIYSGLALFGAAAVVSIVWFQAVLWRESKDHRGSRRR